MKYFNNLTAVESEIIRMDSLSSLLNVLAEGADTSNQEDIENCIWQAKELADSINENLAEEFQNLWDTVRDDVVDDDLTNWPFEEPEEPVYDTKPLSDVIDSWIRNK